MMIYRRRYEILWWKKAYTFSGKWKCYSNHYYQGRLRRFLFPFCLFKSSYMNVGKQSGKQSSGGDDGITMQHHSLIKLHRFFQLQSQLIIFWSAVCRVLKYKKCHIRKRRKVLYQLDEHNIFFSCFNYYCSLSNALLLSVGLPAIASLIKLSFFPSLFKTMAVG